MSSDNSLDNSSVISVESQVLEGRLMSRSTGNSTPIDVRIEYRFDTPLDVFQKLTVARCKSIANDLGMPKLPTYKTSKDTRVEYVMAGLQSIEDTLGKFENLERDQYIGI